VQRILNPSNDDVTLSLSGPLANMIREDHLGLNVSSSVPSEFFSVSQQRSKLFFFYETPFCIGPLIA
jgi:hypothetical protein